ncbi:MAG: hypothetical protein GWO20_15535 [Candidatus Korarchaeota archaeon]|nr:hypothetical protein [Candidatus Korarchaeota archaeon]
MSRLRDKLIADDIDVEGISQYNLEDMKKNYYKAMDGIEELHDALMKAVAEGKTGLDEEHKLWMSILEMAKKSNLGRDL